MFGSKANNTKIKKTTKTSSQIVYNDYENLTELLDIVAGTAIHTKHLQLLIT